MTVIESTSTPILGEPCWDVKCDCQLNLSLNFGSPHLHVSEPHVSKSRLRSVRELFARRLVYPRGKWWLWVYLADWQVDAEGRKIATNTSAFKKRTLAANQLNGQKLLAVEITPATGATRFTFDLGGVLSILRRGRNDDELWLLYKPSGYVLSVRGDGTYCHCPGSGTDKRVGVDRRPLPRLGSSVIATHCAHVRK